MIINSVTSESEFFLNPHCGSNLCESLCTIIKRLVLRIIPSYAFKKNNLSVFLLSLSFPHDQFFLIDTLFASCKTQPCVDSLIQNSDFFRQLSRIHQKVREDLKTTQNIHMCFQEYIISRFSFSHNLTQDRFSSFDFFKWVFCSVSASLIMFSQE